LIDGGIPIVDYNAVRGCEFRESEVILGRDLTEGEAKRHPVWIELFARNRSKLEEVVARVFHAGRNKYGLKKMMCILLPHSSQSHALERAWFVDLLYDGSLALGGDVLDDAGGRLVGIVLEAQEIEKAV